MSITIRKLQPYESAIYRQIRLAGLIHASQYFGSTYEEESQLPKLKFEGYLETDSPDHFMFGAFDAGELIGITGFHRFTRQRDKHRGEVVQVYVDSRYRGQDVGEQLVRSVVEHAFSLEGIEQIQLSLIASNKSAGRLYEKVGFRTFGVQTRYFKMGDTYTDQQFMQLFKTDYQSESPSP